MAVQHNKLTKTFLMGLQPFSFICTGVCKAPGVPAYADYVSPTETRMDQWCAIVKAGVAQRNCMVFVNKQSYLNFISEDGPWGRAFKESPTRLPGHG